jgi:hypothetical protein
VLSIIYLQLILRELFYNLSDFSNTLLIIAHIALSAHFIEALIAAYYAPTRNQTAIKYATYTFFVGTVGLLELWENQDIAAVSSQKEE